MPKGDVMQKVKRSEWATESFADLAKKLVKEKSSVPLTFIIHTYHDQRRIFCFFPESEQEKQKIYRFIGLLLKLWEAKYYGVISESWASTWGGDWDKYPYKQVKDDPNRYDCLTVTHCEKEKNRIKTYKINKKRQLKMLHQQSNIDGKIVNIFRHADEITKSLAGIEHIPVSALTDERRIKLEEFAIKQINMQVEFRMH